MAVAHERRGLRPEGAASAPADFSIDPPALSSGLLNRSEDLREPGRLTAAWSAAKVLPIDADGQLPVTDSGDGVHLAFVDAADVGDRPPAGAVLLGNLGGHDYWAWPDGSAPAGTGHAPRPDRAFRRLDETIRTLGPLLGDDDAALATTAAALLGWHLSARFCSRCGQPTHADVSGHVRLCPAGHQEFPRTDPAVIVLVHDGADRAVLARQPSWAPGRFSVLAGFAEAGESLEATVRREIAEEIGVDVGGVRYLGSQPWPFPRSLMIAFAARAPRDAPLRPRPGEIDDARWFSRGELQRLLRETDDPGAAGRRGGLSLPGRVSIARRMVEGFVRAR